jgi:hypothetical protein
VESQVQALLGLGPTHSSEQEAALTLEEYTVSVVKLVVKLVVSTARSKKPHLPSKSIRCL